MSYLDASWHNNKQPDPPKGGKQRGEMELERQTSEQGNDAIENDSQTDKCGTDSDSEPLPARDHEDDTISPRRNNSQLLKLHQNFVR